MSGRSARGLDWLNFFMANVQTGFGPFIAVYLTTQAWTELEIGLALSIGTFVTMVMQVPAGAMVDATPNKRFAAALALLAIAVSALLLAFWPSPLPVFLSEVLHGFASCVLGPSIAAISLALVGRQVLGERLGRNARYAAVGSGVAAGLLGAAGTWIAPVAVFWLTAALCIPSLVALATIRPMDLHPPVPEEREGGALHGLGVLLRNRGVLIFALCCGLFTLSNAAMLPLAGTQVTRHAGDEANLIIAACIIAPQLIMALIAPWLGRLAELRGRRIALLIGFGALPLRGLLLTLVEGPGWLILVQALDGISAAGLGVMLPLLAADLTRGTNRFNLCMGVFGLTIGIGGTLSTTLAGFAAEWFGPATAFAMLAALGLISVLAVWAAMPETRPPEGKE
ncbi:MFS transporter [Roseomonas xinghualingensis]|uniref:MFS transporter n=1 Tax=Roseomonas xinghualingensis TaxID=2986475 RepID=UPI0021F121EF|nr:MFS transporter [Roseomonas sp. SXEYE001]MCV4207031.1 MFS transporter [Roseomonas sp. SXEYE001]